MTLAEQAVRKVLREFPGPEPLTLRNVVVSAEEKRIDIDLETRWSVSLDTLMLLARALKTMAVTVRAGGERELGDLLVSLHRVPAELFVDAE